MSSPSHVLAAARLRAISRHVHWRARVALARWSALAHRLERIEDQLADVHALVTRAYERHEDGAALVAQMRDEPGYEDAWAPDPLVTVRVATYNRAEILLGRSLASVRRQTYANWEAIVVGDACTDDTAARIAELGDPRIRFENLPVRGPYPEDPGARWMVAGSGPMNRGIELARGAWLAPIDDDDEWDPDHLEVLLAEARRSRTEVVYGKNRLRDARNGRLLNVTIGEWPPREGGFTFQNSVYHRGLGRFRYDLNAYLVREPADWNLVRRMWSAGARFSFLDRPVTTIHHAPTHPEVERWREGIVRTRGYISE